MGMERGRVRHTNQDMRARRQPRSPWATSRGRMIYNIIFSTWAVIIGLLLMIVPSVLGATPEVRPWGAALAGYGLVRGAYFYRRFRALSSGGNPPAPRAARRR